MKQCVRNLDALCLTIVLWTTVDREVIFWKIYFWKPKCFCTHQMKFALQFVPHLSLHSTKIRSKLPIHYKAVWAHFLRYSGAPRSRRARASVAQYLRKYGDLPIREILVITSPYARPSAPRAYQRKKTQWAGMAIGKANATRDYSGGKSLSYPHLVKQRQL